MTRIGAWTAGLGLALGMAASAMGQPSAPWNSGSAPPAPPSPSAQSSLPLEPQSAPPAQPVIDAQQVQTITTQLQTELTRLGGVSQITRCGPVMELVTPQTGGYDRSYGAICELQVADRRMQAVMCDDSRSGKFTLSLAAIRDLDSIRRFIAGNCFPDG